MHALRTLPPHIVRVTLTAALLALLVVGVLFVGANGLNAGRDGASTSAGPAAAPPPVTRAAEPRWVTDPLAPPTFAPKIGG